MQETVENTHRKLRITVAIVAIIAMVYASVTTIVFTQYASIVLRLGKPDRVLAEPGLHFRLPWPMEQITQVDMRKKLFQTQHTEMLTKDKKNVILVSFVIWKVQEPLLFFQSIGNIEQADGKLNGLITNATIGVLGKYDLSALASTDASLLQVQEIEAELLEQTKELAQTQYGIQLEHIGFSRLSLPKENIGAVFQQMRAERKKYAVEFRAKGEQEAGKIRSDTDLEISEITAKTTEEVAKIRGQAEAEAAEIYANAHKQDPELYDFIRSLETLDKVIGNKSTVILRTDAEPFDILVDGK